MQGEWGWGWVGTGQGIIIKFSFYTTAPTVYVTNSSLSIPLSLSLSAQITNYTVELFKRRFEVKGYSCKEQRHESICLPQWGLLLKETFCSYSFKIQGKPHWYESICLPLLTLKGNNLLPGEKILSFTRRHFLDGVHIQGKQILFHQSGFPLKREVKYFSLECSILQMYPCIWNAWQDLAPNVNSTFYILNTKTNLKKTISTMNELRKKPKYWDRQAWANSVDPDQMPQNVASDQGLHCLPLIQHYFRQINR